MAEKRARYLSQQGQVMTRPGTRPNESLRPPSALISQKYLDSAVAVTIVNIIIGQRSTCGQKNSETKAD